MKKATATGSPNIIYKIVFVFIVVVSLHFWDLRGIPQKDTPENILVWVFTGFCFIMVSYKKNLRFRVPIVVFLTGLVLNALASFLNLNQGPVLSLLSYSYYYFIFLYFSLHYFEIDRKFLENLIIVFAIIYSIIFTIQYKIYPFILFNDNPKTALDSSQYEILGHGFLMLAYFLVLNRYLLTHKMIYIFMGLAFFMVQMKSDFRTLIAGAIIITFLMILKLVKLNGRDVLILFVLMIMFAGLSQYKGVSYILNKMTTQTESNISEGKKYVRMIQMEYFFKRYPRNFSYYIIGGGKPAGAKNLYSYNPYAMDPTYAGNYNIVWVDIGLLGFYIVVGGVTVLGMLWYTLKAVFTKVPREYSYLSFYFLYLFIVSFTNEEIFRNGIFTVQAIALYLIDKSANDILNPKSEDSHEVQRI